MGPVVNVAGGVDDCPRSQRGDGKHSFRFDGDDPYVVCSYCDERRSAITDEAIKLRPADEPEAVIGYVVVIDWLDGWQPRSVTAFATATEAAADAGRQQAAIGSSDPRLAVAKLVLLPEPQ